MGKKPIVSLTYENERISIKHSLPYLKCVLRISCVVHGQIYGRFMGFYLNGFVSIQVHIKMHKTGDSLFCTTPVPQPTPECQQHQHPQCPCISRTKNMG